MVTIIEIFVFRLQRDGYSNVLLPVLSHLLQSHNRHHGHGHWSLVIINWNVIVLKDGHQDLDTIYLDGVNAMSCPAFLPINMLKINSKSYNL